jgi:hypothetical protein
MATSAAWAFVRPMEIIKGGEYYKDQRTEDLLNDERIARAQADNDYLQAIRPIAQRGAELDLAVKETAVEDRAIQDAANRLLLIPQVEGMTPTSKVMQQLQLIQQETNPMIQARARQALDLTIPQTAIQLANQGNTLEALNLVQQYTGQKLTPEQSAGLMSNPNQLQAFLANKQLDMSVASQQARAKQEAEMAKLRNDLLKVDRQGAATVESARIGALSRENVARTNVAGDLVVARERVATGTAKDTDYNKLYSDYYLKMMEKGEPPKTRQQWEAAIRGQLRNSATGDLE